MIKKIECFDFDDTLFRNPADTPENRQKYEESTGIPWQIDRELSRQLSAKHGKFIPMRRGWYGRPESLDVPLVPEPIPQNMFIWDICQRLLSSKRNQDILTLLLTGRHAGCANQVYRILSSAGLVRTTKRIDNGKPRFDSNDLDICCWFMGQNGPITKFVKPKPNETLPWKLWILEQYAELYPEAELEMWEDRQPHADEFQKMTFFPKVMVNLVKP